MFDKISNTTPKRILVIDDDHELAFSIKEVLENEDFKVDVAGDGREGIRLQNNLPYDLIITDIVMPQEDGLEVIMWVRANYSTTKLIAISGGGYFDSRDYLIMAKELGASIVFSKPFEVNSLILGVNKLMSNTEIA
jgi:DNA-binding response OmpR family regulator